MTRETREELLERIVERQQELDAHVAAKPVKLSFTQAEENQLLQWLADYRQLFMNLYSAQGVLYRFDEERDEAPEARFVVDCFEPIEDRVTHARDIYVLYRRWCLERSLRPRSQPGLFKALTALGFQSVRLADGRSFVGLKPRAEAMPS